MGKIIEKETIDDKNSRKKCKKKHKYINWRKVLKGSLLVLFLACLGAGGVHIYNERAMEFKEVYKKPESERAVNMMPEGMPKPNEKADGSKSSVQPLDNGNFLVKGKEMTPEEFDAYVLKYRKPIHPKYTQEMKDALLDEAELFYRGVKYFHLDNELEIAQNFIKDYESFKKEQSNENYRMLKSSLSAIEITMKGYVFIEK